MSQENVEVVRRVYDAWANGNFWDATEQFDPDLMLVPRNTAGPDAERYYIGLAGLERFIRHWLNPWTDLAATAEELTESDNSVVVSVRLRATGKASGVPVELNATHVWTFRGHVVIRLDLFDDRADALEAAGLRE